MLHGGGGGGGSYDRRYKYGVDKGCSQFIQDFRSSEKMRNEAQTVFRKLMCPRRGLIVDFEEGDCVEYLYLHKELTCEELIEMEAQRMQKEKEEKEERVRKFKR